METEKAINAGPEMEGREVDNSVEGLKNKRADLEARVAAARQAKEADIAQKINEREQLVAEDARVVPLIEETRGTLEYYEAQNEQGMLTDPGDLVELDNLKQLLAELETQREEDARKYDAIMSQPDVYGKIWDEAHAMDKEKMSEAEAAKSNAEFEAKVREAQQEFKAKADMFIAHLKQYTEDRRQDYQSYLDAAKVFNHAKEELQEIFEAATKGLKEGQYETKIALSVEHCSDFTTYLSNIKEYRNGLGILAGREKAAVDFMGKHVDKINAAAATEQKKDELYKKATDQTPMIKREIGKEYLEFSEQLAAKEREILASLSPSSEKPYALSNVYWDMFSTAAEQGVQNEFSYLDQDRKRKQSSGVK